MKRSHVYTKAAGVLAAGALLPLLMAKTPFPAAIGQPSSNAGTPSPSAKQKTNQPKPAQSSMAPAYNAYISALRVKLDHNWYLSDGKNKVTLAVHVAEDGGVTDLEMSSNPKNTEAEQTASDAFNKSQPLSALPSGSPPVKLTLVFSSTADPHGDNSRDISGRIDPVAPAAKSAGTSDGNDSNSSQAKDAPNK